MSQWNAKASNDDVNIATAVAIRRQLRCYPTHEAVQLLRALMRASTTRSG